MLEHATATAVELGMLKHALRVLGNICALLQSIGQHAQRQCLHSRDRLLLRLPISHCAGKIWNFGDPPAIFFLLNLDVHFLRHVYLGGP